MNTTKWICCISLIMAVVVGLSSSIQEILWGLLGILFFTLFTAFIYSANEDRVTTVTLAILLWIGFFHEPITFSLTVFWMQQIAVLLVLLICMLRAGWQSPRSGWWPLFWLLAIALIPLPISLFQESLLVYLNGLRRIIFTPLPLILGQYLWKAPISKLISRFIVITFLLQLPTGLITSGLRSGSLFDFVAPDYFTGTFGRGGSGSIAILLVITVAYVVWKLLRGYSSWVEFLLVSGCAALLVAIGDLKYVFYLLPISFVSLLLLVVRERRFSANLRVIIIAIFAISMFGFIFFPAINSTAQRWHDGDLSLSGLIDYEMAAPETRTNMFRTVLRWASVDTTTLLFGYGLGSTAEGVLGYTRFQRRYGLDSAIQIGILVLLLETGVVGVVLFAGPLFFFTLQAFFVLLWSKKESPSFEILSGLLFFYGFGMLASLPYNLMALNLRGAGTFWLLAGMWIVARGQLLLESERVVDGHKIPSSLPKRLVSHR